MDRDEYGLTLNEKQSWQYVKELRRASDRIATYAEVNLADALVHLLAGLMKERDAKTRMFREKITEADWLEAARRHLEGKP